MRIQKVATEVRVKKRRAITRKRDITLSAGLAFLLSLSASIAQETDKRKATNAEGVTAARIEPLRVINGELRGRTVLGRFNHSAQLKDFALTFTIGPGIVHSGAVVGFPLPLHYFVGAGPRSIDAKSVVLVAPADNTSQETTRLEFKWRPLEEPIFYRLELMTGIRNWF